MKLIRLFALPTLALAAIGSAQVTQVAQFTGTLTDNFNSYTGGAAGPVFTFLGGNATNTASGATDIWLSNSHGLGGGKAPFGGSMAMAANSPTLTTWDITFNTAVTEVGGKWQSAFDNSTLTFEFFDAGMDSLNSIVVTPPNSGAMTWYGFSYAPGISMMRVTSSQPYFIVDDFTANPVPEPATMVALGAGALALIRRRRK